MAAVAASPVCEYCNKPVDAPLPIHPECARIWLKGWHARDAAERYKFVAKVAEPDVEQRGV